MVLGATIVLRRKFDPEATLQAVAEHQAEVLAVVPVMMQRILKLDEERRATMVSNLLIVLCGERGAQPVINTGSLYQ